MTEFNNFTKCPICNSALYFRFPRVLDENIVSIVLECKGITTGGEDCNFTAAATLKPDEFLIGTEVKDEG